MQFFICKVIWSLYGREHWRKQRVTSVFWWDLPTWTIPFGLFCSSTRSTRSALLPNSFPVVTCSAAHVDTPKQTQKHTHLNIVMLIFTTLYRFWWLLCMLTVTEDTSNVWKCLDALIRQHKAWPEETPTVCFTIWHNHSEGSHSALTRQNKSSDISSLFLFFFYK